MWNSRFSSSERCDIIIFFHVIKKHEPYIINEKSTTDIMRFFINLPRADEAEVRRYDEGLNDLSSDPNLPYTIPTVYRINKYSCAGLSYSRRLFCRRQWLVEILYKRGINNLYTTSAPLEVFTVILPHVDFSATNGIDLTTISRVHKYYTFIYYIHGCSIVYILYRVQWVSPIKSNVGKEWVPKATDSWNRQVLFSELSLLNRLISK